MGTLVLTAEGQAGHTLSVEAPQRGGRRMAEMTFYDPLTPEESAYHFSRSCHLVSVLKTASSEDLIKARVDTPGGGPQASRMEQAGVYVKQSSLKPQLPETAQKRGGWEARIPFVPSCGCPRQSGRAVG